MANLKASCFPYLFKLSCRWMGNSASSGGSVSAGIGYKACLYGPKYEESCVQHEEYTSDIVENSMKPSSLEDLEISSSSEEEDLEHLMVQKLGTSLSEVVLQVHDTLEPLCVSNMAASQDENFNTQDTQLLYLVVDVPDGSSKHMNDLCSSRVQPYPLILDVVDILSCSTVQNDDFSKTETPAFAYPLPDTKLISALKGSRVSHGKCPSTKLSVKWAPDVYDPPITSSSHTLRGHQRHHRHKSKQDHHGHKPSKIKSSHGNAVERKHAPHRRTSSRTQTDAHVSRSQALRTCDGEESKAESPEHAIRGSPESIIRGSCCYVEPLTPLPFHVAC